MEKVERKYGLAITGFCAPIVPSLSFPYFASTITTAAKIVVILRNPVDRTFAHWRWDEVLLRPVAHDPLWKHRPDFDEVIRTELAALKDFGMTGFSVSGLGGGYGSYIQHSIYLPFVKALLKFYQRESILFINAKDFFKDSISTAKKVYSFLGLPPYEPVEMAVRNAAPAGKPADPTRKMLADFFAPLNKQLYECIGADFGWE
jgi:hypothetical protein